MKNKVLVVVIAVLAAALILETGYLLRSRRNDKSKPGTVVSQQAPVLRYRSVHPAFSPLHDMRDWDPFAEMEMMQQRMHRIFDDSFSKGLADKTIFRMNASFEPNISISQKDNAYLVKADLPGMDKNTINIEVTGRELAISGERKEEETRQDKGFYRQELSYGSFSRSILLPKDALTDRITSHYENGVLTITIPKDTFVKPAPAPVKVPVQ